MQRLWIPGRLPGLNELIAARASFGEARGARGRRFSAYGEIKANFSERVRWQAAACKLQPVAGPAFFTYLFREADRRRDPSNVIAGGVKIIEDALKECQIIRGDGWSVVLGIAPYWMLDSRAPGATVFLTEDKVLERDDAIWRDESERKANGQG